MVLRGLCQTVKGLPCFQIAPHQFETGCHGDFVVRQAAGRKWILIPIFASCAVALVVIPFKISCLTRIISFKSNPDGPTEIVQVTTFQVVDFSPFSANKQTLGTDP
jgi:hypothetical protein